LGLGDIVGATGRLFKTKTGELSVKVAQVRLLAKALRPLPEKFHGMTDQEQRYRQRYVDLITNASTREVFVKRSQIVQAIRAFFVRHGYLEVETPMMHPIPGGAAARPFVTHHNALDMELFLRIAPELYLKKLVIGGLERCSRSTRSFRNEGISSRHQSRIHDAGVLRGLSGLQLPDGPDGGAAPRSGARGATAARRSNIKVIAIDLGKPFDRLTMAQAIHRYNPQYPVAQLDELDYLKDALAAFKVEVFPTDGVGLLQLKLFEETTEGKLVQPTFIVKYLTDVSPLARANDADPTFTDRFELFMTGRGVCQRPFPN